MHERILMYLQLPRWIVDRWWLVAYLQPPPFAREKFEAVLEKGPDERFNAFVTDQLKALVEGGTAPPPEIAGPILNFADDLAAGRQPTLRAGDYIALRTYMRGKGA